MALGNWKYWLKEGQTRLMQRAVCVNDNEIPQTLAYAEWMPPFAQPN